MRQNWIQNMFCAIFSNFSTCFYHYYNRTACCKALSFFLFFVFCFFVALLCMRGSVVLHQLRFALLLLLAQVTHYPSLGLLQLRFYYLPLLYSNNKACKKLTRSKITRKAKYEYIFKKVRDNRTRADLTENTICTQVEYQNAQNDGVKSY